MCPLLLNKGVSGIPIFQLLALSIFFRANGLLNEFWEEHIHKKTLGALVLMFNSSKIHPQNKHLQKSYRTVPAAFQWNLFPLIYLRH